MRHAGDPRGCQVLKLVALNACFMAWVTVTTEFYIDETLFLSLLINISPHKQICWCVMPFNENETRLRPALASYKHYHGCLGALLLGGHDPNSLFIQIGIANYVVY